MSLPNYAQLAFNLEKKASNIAFMEVLLRMSVKTKLKTIKFAQYHLVQVSSTCGINLSYLPSKLTRMKALQWY